MGSEPMINSAHDSILLLKVPSEARFAPPCVRQTGFPNPEACVLGTNQTWRFFLWESSASGWFFAGMANPTSFATCPGGVDGALASPCDRLLAVCAGKGTECTLLLFLCSSPHFSFENVVSRKF